MGSFGDVMFWELGIVLGLVVGFFLGFVEGWIRRGRAEKGSPREKSFLERHAEYRHAEKVWTVARGDPPTRR